MTDKSDSDNEVFNQLLLEQSWLEASRNVLRVRPIEDYLQLAFAENANLNDSVDVIRQFTLLIEKGITPPASILSAVAKSFRNYLDIEPHDSLDTAFNLNKKQRIGHPLAYRAVREQRGRIFYLMWCLRHDGKLKGKEPSIEEVAGVVINKLSLDLTEDVLKKDYISKQADSIFDGAFEALRSLEKQ